MWQQQTKDRRIMTTEQKEQLREVLIDYLQVLTSNIPLYNTVAQGNKIAQVRLLLREVA
jgi:hypothetical protein